MIFEMSPANRTRCDLLIAIGGIQQVTIRREGFAIDVGGAPSVVPIGRANQHDHPLLRRLDHLRQRPLQHRIALLRRQQRENIGVRREPFMPPKIAVVATTTAATTDRPEPWNPSAQIQNSAASSLVMACSPVWIAEKTMRVRSPLGFVDGDVFDIGAAVERDGADRFGHAGIARFELDAPGAVASDAVDIEIAFPTGQDPPPAGRT